MKFIDFNSNKCRHCYKCVRNCDIKAISVLGGRAEIMEDRCILCGRCLAVCPQEAKTLLSELELVKSMIRNGEKVAAQLAPSYLGLFQFRERGQMRSALRKLGFVDVFETAEGAAVVTDAYLKLVEEGKMDNIITTCCPAVNDLVEMYYPSAVSFLAPVVSPMIAEGRIIKKQLGSNTRVVFIGPCIAKKREARDERHADAVDAVISFRDLNQWLGEENISIQDCEDEPFPFDPAVNRLYPVTGGVLTSMRAAKSCPEGWLGQYRSFYVRGPRDCVELCTDLEKGIVHGCLIEMNICEGGCVKGPTITEKGIYKYKVKLDMQDAVPNRPPDDAELRKRIEGIRLEKRFEDRLVQEVFPTEQEIREILKKTGKESAADELNCGACGYPTCRQKAIAVFQGKAELEMCIPHLTAQAESMANLVLRESPNAFVIVDSQLRILEYSAVGERYFGVSREHALKMKLSDLIDPRDCETVRRTKRNIYGKKVFYPEYDLWTLQNIVYIPRRDSTLMTLIDITEQEKRARLEQETRNATIEMAQNVIRNQMITAQKIASLLGETTAETKITLSRLVSAMHADASESAGDPEVRQAAEEARSDGTGRTAGETKEELPPFVDAGLSPNQQERKLKINTRYAKQRPAGNTDHGTSEEQRVSFGGGHGEATGGGAAEVL